jgi:hypothetical protein
MIRCRSLKSRATQFYAPRSSERELEKRKKDLDALKAIGSEREFGAIIRARLQLVPHPEDDNSLCWKDDSLINLSATKFFLDFWPLVES